MTTTAPTLEQIACSAIAPHASNPRQHVGDVAELADSIKSQGVLEPLIVAPIADNARSRKYLLIAGHRRLAAAKAAKVKTVPAIVRADLDTTAKQIEAMLVENLHRVDLSPIEEGDAYQALLDLGDYTQEKISKATGRSKTVVRDRLKLSKLPESVRERVIPGQISLSDASAMAEFLDDPAALAELEKVVGTYNFGWKVQQLRDAKVRAKKQAAARKELDKAGVTVLDDYPEDTCVELSDLIPADAWPTDPDDGGEDAVFDKFRDEHASCPGHVAILAPRMTEPDFVCTRPDLHPAAESSGADQPKAATPPTPEELQAQRDEEELRAVAKVRRAYLGKIVRAADNDALALEFLRRPWIETVTEKRGTGQDWKVKELRTLAEILYDAPDRISDEDLPEQLLGTIRTLSVQALAILDNIDLFDEKSLERALPHVWTGEYSNTKDWRTRLVEDFGYQWSDVELRMLGETTDATQDNRVCRECGCTDEAACTPPCSWAEPDLCSACTGLDANDESGEVA